MLTQFFGNYLLQKKLVTSTELIEGLKYKSILTKKLGVLAVSAGYMTPEEVEDVHTMQASIDKRFAEIAVHMGYLTIPQAEEIIEAQKFGYILLGNSLVELGYVPLKEIHKAIKDYEGAYQLSYSNLLESNEEKMYEMVQSLYHFPETESINYKKEYVALLIKNLIRFIGNDYTLLDPEEALPESESLWTSTQSIDGFYNSRTSIVASEDSFIAFASRYAGEECVKIDEFVQASVSDFLNLHNGLFTVNMSNNHNVELSLSPPEIIISDFPSNKNSYIIPIKYPFGILYCSFSK
mgnify:CR=1 FL=1